MNGDPPVPVPVIPPTPKQSADILKTAGQRRVNIIWEMTQAIIALAVTGVTLYVSAVLGLTVSQTTAFNLLSNAFFLVVGFYFGRTNHQRTGGIGGNQNEEGR